MNDDLEHLEELGLLRPEEPTQDVANIAAEPSRASPRALFRPTQGVEHRGARWFEELVEDSLLGRIKRQKGKHTSTDGRTREEWEVVEWTVDSEDTSELSMSGTGKRKRGEPLLETDDRMDTQT
jgi:hypothetical protein